MAQSAEMAGESVSMLLAMQWRGSNKAWWRAISVAASAAKASKVAHRPSA
jgi:hypothetical protein